MAQLQRVAFSPNQIHHTHITLKPKQTHYLCQVLRLKGGDRFIAMDGPGQWWLACLNDDIQTAQILERLSVDNELPLPIHLLAAPPKGNGFEDVIRGATELGVSTIIPLISERTVLSPSPKKIERWRRISLEAAEQCCRQQIPKVLDPVPLVDVQNQNLAVNTEKTDQWICSTATGSQNLWHHLSTTGLSSKSRGVTLITGPEGGWSPEEERLMMVNGYQPISLGNRVLRAVTAPITVLSVLSVYLEAHHPDPSVEPWS